MNDLFAAILQVYQPNLGRGQTVRPSPRVHDVSRIPKPIERYHALEKLACVLPIRIDGPQCGVFFTPGQETDLSSIRRPARRGCLACDTQVRGCGPKDSLFEQPMARAKVYIRYPQPKSSMVML